MKTVLCYGDSNTYGTKPVDQNFLDTPFNPHDFRFPKEKRWTGILQKELGADHDVIEEGLNGRTTVLDDPIEGADRNGLTYLPPCLESHAPIDLVVLMLGTNDLKARFSLTAFDIAMGIKVLIDTIKASGSGPGMRSPEILLLCPPPLGKLTDHAGLFTDGVEESKKLAGNYKRIAKLFGCHFMDVGSVIKPSDDDGLHYEEQDVERLGLAVAQEVKRLLG